MWLSTQTRLDIANAVRAVARYCAAPKQVHWKAALFILGYVKRTTTFGITFKRGSAEGLSMLAFADSDYASKAADRRSVSGGGNNVCRCGCIVVFKGSEVRDVVDNGGRVRTW